MSENTPNIEALLKEGRRFPPSKEFADQANANHINVYEEAERDFELFWKKWAEKLHWFKPWDKVLDWKAPFAKWFVNGKTNVSYNCLDRHLKDGKQDKLALIWEGEPGDVKTYTYLELHQEVCRFANGLKNIGVKKGDRVTIYMPMIPELAIATLACSRIGAPHSVVFGGFSPEALGDRINDCASKVVITADGGHRRGKVVPLKQNCDVALTTTSTVEKVVVARRIGMDAEIKMDPDRDIWWEDLIAESNVHCEAEQMDSEDMLYILYTSGTTGKPKGVVHTTGGYLVGTYATTNWIFDLKESDIYWCTADIGWITGHSYVIYGPLANGTTTVMYEGAPDYPDKDRFWDIIERHSITIMYTAPTAIRACMRWGEEHPQKHNLSSLRLLGSVGEPINPEAWMWYWNHIGGGKCPIVDTWWQTETGMILITPLPGITNLTPGSATSPFPGIVADVVDVSGNTVERGQGGYLVLKRPWPAMMRTIYGDRERYIKEYWTRYPGMYFTGDGAKRDSEGFFWLLGRVDDVINVAGHRISTMEVESALVDHEVVAEAASIGRSHDIKGQSIVAFVTLKDTITASEDLGEELKRHVASKIGGIAKPDEIYFSEDLPKTRSGKIMRRLLRDIAEGRILGDTTTLADPNIIQSLKEQYDEE